jgi:hypothetical protein
MPADNVLFRRKPMPRLRWTKVPTAEELATIPLASACKFELSEKEAKQMRSEIYKINRDGIRRFHTMRDGPFIMVWRIK